jgi:hypothetical protein
MLDFAAEREEVIDLIRSGLSRDVLNVNSSGFHD